MFQDIVMENQEGLQRVKRGALYMSGEEGLEICSICKRAKGI